MRRTLLIGIGNPYRRDDAAGIIAVQRARPLLPKHVESLECTGDLTALLAVWQGARCIIVDAMRSDGVPGTVVRIDSQKLPLLAELHFFSTHAVGLPEVIGLARALGRLPDELVLFGIEGADFSEGEGLSPEVEKAVEDVVRYILREVLEGEANA